MNVSGYGYRIILSNEPFACFHLPMSSKIFSIFLLCIAIELIINVAGTLDRGEEIGASKVDKYEGDAYGNDIQMKNVVNTGGNKVVEEKEDGEEDEGGEDEYENEEEEDDEDDPQDDEDIYGPCSDELTERTAVIANGKYLLVYDPEMFPCVNFFVERQNNREWEAKECIITSSEGWNWFRGFSPGENNTFRIYHKLTKEVLLYGTKFFLPEVPPPVTAVEIKIGPGQVWAYFTVPKEKAPNLLGFRVSLLDKEIDSDWKEVGVFENVVYRCIYPELWPVHPCPSWRTDRIFCALFTDSVWWTNNASHITNTTMKYIKVETFRIPTKPPYRIYSDPFIKPLYILDPEGAVRGSYNLKQIQNKEEHEMKNEWSDELWVILISLFLSLLAVGLPLIHYRASRDGLKDAQSSWEPSDTCTRNLPSTQKKTGISWRMRISKKRKNSEF